MSYRTFLEVVRKSRFFVKPAFAGSIRERDFFCCNA